MKGHFQRLRTVLKYTTSQKRHLQVLIYYRMPWVALISSLKHFTLTKCWKCYTGTFHVEFQGVQVDHFSFYFIAMFISQEASCVACVFWFNIARSLPLCVGGLLLFTLSRMASLSPSHHSTFSTFIWHGCLTRRRFGNNSIRERILNP